MEIKLYNNKSDRRYVNKNITQIASATFNYFNTDFSKLCTGISDCMLTTDNKTIMDSVNYASVKVQNRVYYMYIDDILYHDGLFDIRATIDVLMTFADDLRATTAIVERQENVYNGYIVDNSYKANAYNRIQAKLFPIQPFGKDYTYVLNVNGG